MLVERTVDPEELRLVVAVPVAEEPADRVVRVFWSTLPVERAVEEPVERLVVAVPRLVAELELPVERLVRVFWSTLPAERVVEEPVERLTEEELLPVERLVVAELELPVEKPSGTFEWKTQVLEEPEERLTEELLPEERLVWLCTEAERDGVAAAEALP